jgi:hypothetical protein
MNDHRKRKENRQGSLKEFVTVAFAEDMELAKQYKKLLNDGDIPAVVKNPSEDAGGFPGIAVMVPEDHIDEAHVLIESQGAYNDFYDMVFHDDEYTTEDFEDNDGF